MAINKQRRVLPLGSLLQNEPHLRRHTLTLARNAHFNWSEALAINGGIGILDGQGIVPVDGVWPDGALILARTERPDHGGTTSPWVIQVQARDCSVWIEFPDIPIAPVEVFPYTAGWGFATLELDLPVGIWHKAIITVEDIEPGAKIAWLSWGERPLTAAELIPPSAAPSNTLAPVIFGTEAVGETLTCSPPGTWTGFPAPTYAYQWYQAPSTSIMGANAFQYVVQAGDAGLDLFCRVTATNTAGSSDADSNTLSIPTVGASALLLESGDYLLLEDGSKLLLE